MGQIGEEKRKKDNSRPVVFKFGFLGFPVVCSRSLRVIFMIILENYLFHGIEICIGGVNAMVTKLLAT